MIPLFLEVRISDLDRRRVLLLLAYLLTHQSNDDVIDDSMERFTPSARNRWSWRSFHSTYIASSHHIVAILPGSASNLFGRMEGPPSFSAIESTSQQ